MGLEHDFTILAGILSTPLDFLESIFDKILVISESVTGRNENLGVSFVNSSEYWDVPPDFHYGNLYLYQ